MPKLSIRFGTRECRNCMSLLGDPSSSLLAFNLTFCCCSAGTSNDSFYWISHQAVSISFNQDGIPTKHVKRVLCKSTTVIPCTKRKMKMVRRIWRRKAAKYNIGFNLKLEKIVIIYRMHQNIINVYHILWVCLSLSAYILWVCLSLIENLECILLTIFELAAQQHWRNWLASLDNFVAVLVYMYNTYPGSDISIYYCI